MKKFKNRKVLVLAVVLVLLGGFAVARVVFHAGASAHANVYYCPMHPTYTSDRPGTCPICNMSLVKREAEEEPRHDGPAHDHSIVGAGFEPASTLPDEGTGLRTPEDDVAPREFTVEELVRMKPEEICLLHKCKMGKCMIAMTEEFARLGKCPHCGEDLGVTIKNAPPEGYTRIKLGPGKQEILGVQTAPVQKVQMAKTIRTVGRIAYDPELYQAEEEYLQALEASRKAEASMTGEIKEQAAKLADAAKIKLRLLGLSDELIRDVENAAKPDRSLLYSDPGGRVWLYAPIYEYELSLVKAGDSVEAEAAGIPGEKFEGVIRSIDSVLDPMTRSARARAVLENPEGLLKPEMYANATLRIDLGEKLSVPGSAVFATGEKNIVFVSKPDGNLEPREVVLGMTTDEFSEVRSGVGEGEQVVTSGNFLIDSESRLKAALQGMGSKGGGHQHGG